MRKYTLLLLLFCSFASCAGAQDTSRLDKVLAFPDKLFDTMDREVRKLESGLDRQTQKYLSKLQKQEKKLYKKLLKKDSTLAKELFSDIEGQYNKLKEVPKHIDRYRNVYSGKLDSLTTTLHFLKGDPLSPLSSNPQVEQLLSRYKSLQGKLNATAQIQSYLKGRQQLLKEQFRRLGMVKELRKYQKEVYYYGAQVREFKALLEDPSKIERKLLELALKVPQFRDFFAKHSQLGQLFALPTSSGSNAASLQGLQTRASVQQLLQDRFGSGASVTQMLQQNVQGAQGELNALKDKMNQYSSGSYGNSNGDLEQPDFKPNDQKTKSFFKRLEFGGNIQSQKARFFFPVTSDIGLSLGYKLNERSIVGVGAAYMLGWGSGWRDIEISHQGVGLRSFLDWKLKGSFYVSVGYEVNYRSLFNSLDQLQNYSAWQSSGLVGLSKKYQVSKKLKGSMQLLWDFLSHQQIPKTQAILFRIGYSLK